MDTHSRQNGDRRYDQHRQLDQHQASRGSLSNEVHDEPCCGRVAGGFSSTRDADDLSPLASTHPSPQSLESLLLVHTTDSDTGPPTVEGTRKTGRPCSVVNPDPVVPFHDPPGTRIAPLSRSSSRVYGAPPSIRSAWVCSRGAKICACHGLLAQGQGLATGCSSSGPRDGRYSPRYRRRGVL
jgi:hypothetical protein